MFNYFYRVFLWNNGQRGAELTSRVVLPIFVETRLDETLKTAKVELKGVPVRGWHLTNRPLAPKTKLIIEVYRDQTMLDLHKSYDLVVEHDDVEIYPAQPNVCTHRINLICPSVVAQGMHVDNIALTYAIRDVNMNYRTTWSDPTTLAGANALIVAGVGHGAPVSINQAMAVGQVFFTNSFRYNWTNTASIGNLLLQQNALQQNTVNFTIPTLMLQGGNNTWQDLHELPVLTTVVERHYRGATLLSQTEVFRRQTGLNTLPTVPAGQANIWGLGGRTFFGSASPEFVGNTHIRRISNFASNTGMNPGLHNPNQLSQFSNNFTPATGNAMMIDVLTTNSRNFNASFTTRALTETQLANNERLDYQIQCVMVGVTNVLTSYTRRAHVAQGNNQFGQSVPGFANWSWIADGDVTEVSALANTIEVSGTISMVNMEQDNSAPFLVRPRPYNAHDLLQRAITTIDTHVINNNVEGLDDFFNTRSPIIIDPSWRARLLAAQIFETVFEQKNLWELLLQVGNYLHAIPRLDFARDGTDRFVLSFKQLGDTRQRLDDSRKLTVFNSNNLNEFHVQHDSYVTNLFSPQNVIDEFVVAKTSDPTFLISNNTAEIHLSYNITELELFEIRWQRVAGGAWETRNATQFVFAKPIYDIISNENPNRVRPAKGNSLYFEPESNKILGLNFVPPSVNPGEFRMSLRRIIEILWQGQNVGGILNNIRFNDLRFRVRYRTQDNVRVTQFRPDLENFMRNSSLESYPRHEQFRGQTDKIVDSERFSRQQWGELIRRSNDKWECNELPRPGNEKEEGDLVEIDGESYYVMSIENECYNQAIKQKVTYSKNFNQISNVVVIPAEPRFYEVSERSLVRREIRLLDFFKLSTDAPTASTVPRFLNATQWRQTIRGLMFLQSRTLPNYAHTRFQVDRRRIHRGSWGQVMPLSQMFPSSLVDRTDPNNVRPRGASDNSQCIVPLSHKPLYNGIIFAWEMQDNFKAADFTDPNLQGNTNVADNAYMAQQPMRYCDVMGRADFFRFALFSFNPTALQIQALPRAETGSGAPNDPFTPIPLPAQPFAQVQGGINNAIALDKDNREALSFNYQIQLLHNCSESGDDFLTFPNIMGQKDSNLRMCFLDRIHTMFDERIDLSPARVLVDNVAFTLVDDPNGALRIDIPQNTGVDLSLVRSIVFYQEAPGIGRHAYIIKNVAQTPNNQKLNPLFIYPVFNT